MEDQTVKNPDKGGVQSVARIFELIEVLAAHPAGASLQRLAEDAHLAKSTTVCWAAWSAWDMPRRTAKPASTA